MCRYMLRCLGCGWGYLSSISVLYAHSVCMYIIHMYIINVVLYVHTIAYIIHVHGHIICTCTYSTNRYCTLVCGLWHN